MPFRSMKMNFFMCGFHRRVWCPKWTPASSRSFIVISATWPPIGFVRRPAVSARASRHSDGTPARRLGRVSFCVGVLPLAELEPLACARLPVLLALDHARVARQVALAPELRLERLVRAHERARDGHADRAGLAREPAARDPREDVVLVAHVRR